MRDRTKTSFLFRSFFRVRSSIDLGTSGHLAHLAWQVQIDVRQAEALFDVLDYNNSGTLDSEEFLEAITQQIWGSGEVGHG